MLRAAGFPDVVRGGANTPVKWPKTFSQRTKLLELAARLHVLVANPPHSELISVSMLHTDPPAYPEKHRHHPESMRKNMPVHEVLPPLTKSTWPFLSFRIRYMRLSENRVPPNSMANHHFPYYSYLSHFFPFFPHVMAILQAMTHI